MPLPICPNVATPPLFFLLAKIPFLTCTFIFTYQTRFVIQWLGTIKRKGFSNLRGRHEEPTSLKLQYCPLARFRHQVELPSLVTSFGISRSWGPLVLVARWQGVGEWDQFWTYRGYPSSIASPARKKDALSELAPGPRGFRFFLFPARKKCFYPSCSIP